MKKLFLLLVIILGSAIAFSAGWFSRGLIIKRNPSPSNPHLAFLEEVKETIKQNYWERIPEEQLGELFLSAGEKVSGQPQLRKKTDPQTLWQSLEKILEKIPEEKKIDFVTQVADLVLTNLQPVDRSRLYTQKEEKSLAEAVYNVTNEDFYQTLEVPKQANEEEITKAYQEKKTQLEKEASFSPTASAQLKKLQKAYQTLSEKENRQFYDQAGIEPTIEYALLHPDVLHLHLKKISPTSLEELQRVTQKFDKDGGPTSLILDLRDNVGGSLDILPYLLGPFIGPDSEAFRLYQQGEKHPFRTQTGWLPSLVRYKKVVILINQNTQSSAEAMAGALKKYNVGVLVGTPTKGWGTIERVFPLTNQISQNIKYSIFLVHSLVLADDGQPIEGRGIQPTIDINNPNWKKELENYFNYPSLIEAVSQLVK
ncbi:MAG: S41 family peptidase [Microgenomates group bacterium]